jgi:hypothetical protein
MLWYLAIYFVASAVSVAVFGGLVVALPANYFAEERERWSDRHPVWRWLRVIGKNLLGLAIIGLGVFLSLPGMPGQGLLTMAIGATLIDFPGKRRLVLRVVRRRGVLNGLNRVRRFFSRPPLIAP